MGKTGIIGKIQLIEKKPIFFIVLKNGLLGLFFNERLLHIHEVT